MNGKRRRTPRMTAESGWQEKLVRTLELLPDAPGVYLFKDVRGRVIYVGKAKRLPARVRSYFHAGATTEPRHERLRDQMRSLEYVVTASEAEALVLEANLIRSYFPRYNVSLKDDKRFPLLKLTMSHPFPRLEITRRVLPDGALYYGPFPHGRDLRQLLKSLRRIFPLRSCSDRRLTAGGRGCLEYFIGLCPAPCTGRATAESYALAVAGLRAFFEGRGRQMLMTWRRRMRELAAELRFEESAALRDDIARLTALMQSQEMADPRRPDLDAVGFTARGGAAAATVLSHRDGAVVGAWPLIVEKTREAPPPEIMEAILMQHYTQRRQIPPLILCAPLPRNREVIEGWLSSRAQRRVHIRQPLRGPRLALLQRAGANAHLRLEEHELMGHGRGRRAAAEIYALQSALKLPKPPRRIEGFDISNLQGALAVGAQVVFVDGRPAKGAYRRFRVRTVSGADDLAMLAEVLGRRLLRVAEAGEEQPDLILIDGGRGQVGRAAQVLASQGLEEIPLAGLAKRAEEIYLRGQAAPLRLARSSPALQLLQRVRDEAHRFAVGYHRHLRRGALVASPFADVAGVGPQRTRELLRHFGSLQALQGATREELARVARIGPALAERIHCALHREASHG